MYILINKKLQGNTFIFLNKHIYLYDEIIILAHYIPMYYI